ncbi:long-chain acyl-CoA synthetase [Thermocatellispora tengchongensis]|uniref:Acyl-CoA synthetase n=1 Tax=Thermocatellispora tengchongensis TaxID=1073253 RepID=A0A840PCR2_9ACTN|nr:AMP-dependent synthetase/ligase [Thermocatellispora tengchongensis]MBB5139204.1 long-chain acyl-CoA synthetase [Thermocatellispora tengchongensis]
MREFSVEPLVEIADGATLTDMAYDRARREPDLVALAARTPDGWREVRYGEFAAQAADLARSLLGAGVRPGDRVAILGGNSVDWLVADFAALSLGAITVPVYPTASAEQIRAVLDDAGPVACFTAPEARPRLLSALPSRDIAVWSLGGPLPSPARRAGAADLAEHRAAVRADDPATIVYTSGTTGTPKGVVLTHRNILAAACNVVALLPELFNPPGTQASTLLFLPLAHVYGRVVAFGGLWAGVKTGLVASANDLVAELPVFRPHFLAGVPYVLEKIRKALRQRLGEAAFAPAEQAAMARGAARRRGETVEPATGDPVRQALHTVLGGRLTHMICGGASLDPDTLDFFTGMDLTVLGAYGLTETTSTATMSAPTANRLGRSGRPVPGTTVAVADDGEILIRGPHVSPGYWRAPAEPQEWVHTGDLGDLDDDGYLKITGRRKEILVTSGGKNVAPAVLEDRLRQHPLISNCMLVGEARPYVTALITVDPSAASRDDLEKEIAAAVQSANTLVSRAESIRAFRILPTEFTIARGHLTPSLRLRRAAIEKDFAAEIEAMYPA